MSVAARAQGASAGADRLPAGAERRLALALGTAMMGDGGVRHVHALCDTIGRRPAGSPAERLAVEYVLRAMEEAGLRDVHEEPFDTEHWFRGRTVAELTGPVAREIALLALPGTLDHDVEAPVVWAPQQTREEFLAAADVFAGAIVINTSIPKVGLSGSGGPLHRGERNRLVFEAGAAAFVWVAQRPGHILPTGSVARDIGEAMPSFGISLEDATFIERLLARGDRVTMRIGTRNERRAGTSWNIVGDHGPSDGPITMLSAHHDSHDVTVGAFDNAAGCAAVLEAARALTTLGSESGRLRVAIFGAEESGLQGSGRYVERHADQLDDVRFLFNLDGLGAVPSWKYVHVPMRADVVQYIDAVFRRYGFRVEVEEALALNWDHAPFALRGVPVASLTAKWPPGTHLHYGHTSADTPDKIDGQDMRLTTACTVALAGHIMLDRTWSLPHLDAETVAERLKGVERAES
ncbi:MAG: M20/M25/M40 family metallo-hydrolase [Trueperaceae bacterium]|nr:M20/M25/M40 family metallo-hydrolase [Trueperaceae bacterium]